MAEKVYRKSVGCVLLNQDNLVFLAKRINKNTSESVDNSTNKNLPHLYPNWQMPQGGVEQNETLDMALFRELLEEIGTSNISIMAKTNTLFYDFPPEIAKTLAKDFGTYYVGQEQVWFFCRFLGEDADFNFKFTSHPEFEEFEWATVKVVLERCVAFKKELYQEIFNQAKFLQLL